jgi:hypothetical protein
MGERQKEQRPPLMVESFLLKRALLAMSDVAFAKLQFLKRVARVARPFAIESRARSPASAGSGPEPDAKSQEKPSWSAPTSRSPSAHRSDAKRAVARLRRRAQERQGELQACQKLALH